jgi:hypothetical protein
MEISCSSLWNLWRTNSSNDFSTELVEEAKNRIAKFSKEDWSEMTKEAIEITNNLSYLVKNNISVDSKLAEKAFDDLIGHVDKWFFKTTYSYIATISIKTRDTSTPVHRFFDQFEPGLGMYVSKLLITHSRKVQ